MDEAALGRRLDAYVAAWRTYDAAAIGALLPAFGADGRCAELTELYMQRSD